MSLHTLLSRRSGILDAVGDKALRFWLYRQNLSFNPDQNGEHWLLHAMKSQGIMLPTPVIVDIGANEGRWARQCLDLWPSSEMHLFEPSKTTAARLSDTFQNVHAVVVSDADGEVRFAEETQNSHSHITATGGYTVPAVNASRLHDITGAPHIDFVKVDTEGHDLKIVSALLPLLQAGSVRALQFEHHGLTNSYGEAFGEFAAKVAQAGCGLWRIMPSWLERRDPGATAWRDLVGPNYVVAGPAMIPVFRALERS